MPFESLIAHPTRPWSVLADLPAPGQLPEPANFSGQPAALRLADLPNEMLLCVVHELDGAAVLAMSQVCQQMHQLLLADPVCALHLSPRIRWVVSASGFADVARILARMSRTNRAPPLLALAAQRDALHPTLQPRAQRELDALTAGDPCTDVEIQLQTERRRQADQAPGRLPSRLPPLEAVVALPAEARARLLVQWIPLASRHGPENGVDGCPLERWEQIAESLPQRGAAELLCALLAHTCPLYQDRWVATVELALRRAEKIAPAEHPDRVALLVAAGNASSEAVANQPDLRRIWDRVLELACALPCPQRKAVLVSLAPYTSVEICQGPDMMEELGLDTPAWQTLRDRAVALLPPEDAADVLAAMAAFRDDDDCTVTPRRAPMMAGLIVAAAQLPDQAGARALASILTWEAGLEPTQFEPFWNGILAACDAATPACQALLLPALADSVPLLLADPHFRGGGCDSTVPARWQMLFERTMVLPAPMRLKAAHALLGIAYLLPVQARCGDLLLELAQTLAPPDRAPLLAAMVRLGIKHASIAQACWPRLVSLIVGLPDEQRPQPLRELVRLLVRRAEEDRLGAAAPTVPITGTDLLLGHWPASADEAYRQASAALRLLPLRAVAATLAELAASVRDGNWRLLWWLLVQAQSLAHSGLHASVAVTRVCAALRRFDDRQAHTMLVPLATKTAIALPAAERGSAFYFLGDLIPLGCVDPATAKLIEDAIAHLPDADRSHVARPTKRKAPG